jgi:hypothetical protein
VYDSELKWSVEVISGSEDGLDLTVQLVISTRYNESLVGKLLEGVLYVPLNGIESWSLRALDFVAREEVGRAIRSIV